MIDPYRLNLGGQINLPELRPDLTSGLMSLIKTGIAGAGSCAIG
jgi:hypothetical protein